MRIRFAAANPPTAYHGDAKDNRPARIKGFFAPWGELSGWRRGKYGLEKYEFQAGAFDNYLNAGENVQLSVNHDTDPRFGNRPPLADTRSERMAVRPVDGGMGFGAMLPPVGRGPEILFDVQNGLIPYTSFTIDPDLMKFEHDYESRSGDGDTAPETWHVHKVYQVGLPEVSILSIKPAFQSGSTQAAFSAVDMNQFGRFGVGFEAVGELLEQLETNHQATMKLIRTLTGGIQ